jgi:hypothetical protein
VGKRKGCHAWSRNDFGTIASRFEASQNKRVCLSLAHELADSSLEEYEFGLAEVSPKRILRSLDEILGKGSLA